jgi:hypothetical protein
VLAVKTITAETKQQFSEAVGMDKKRKPLWLLRIENRMKNRVKIGHLIQHKQGRDQKETSKHREQIIASLPFNQLD